MNRALVVLGFLLIPLTALGDPTKQHAPAAPGSIGHGKGTAGRTKLPLPAPGGSGSPTSVLALASWLDDADTLTPQALGTSVLPSAIRTHWTEGRRTPRSSTPL